LDGNERKKKNCVKVAISNPSKRLFSFQFSERGGGIKILEIFALYFYRY
jgi:hypothetical protein